MSGDEECSCPTPDVHKREGQLRCHSCAREFQPNMQDLEDLHSEAATKSRTTSRSALDLSWPTSVEYLNTEIENGEAIANFLRGNEGERNPAEHTGSEMTSTANSNTPSAQSSAYKDARFESDSTPSNEMDSEKIRLLLLTRGNRNDPLHGTLEVTSFKDKPKYEALSYTWAVESDESDKSGDDVRPTPPPRERPLFISGKWRILGITKNCEAALKAIREPGKDRLHWIDAICINQDNPDEKSVQIGLMSKIYDRATKVLVYLGEANEETNKALAIMNQDPRITECQNDSLYSQCLQNLFARKYFTRVWVIQEIAAAKDVVLYCGQQRAPWLNFRDVSDKKQIPVGSVVPGWITLCRANVIRRPESSLGEWLFRGMPCHASRAEDKVFAFFGLLVGADSCGLVADYRLAVEQVYTGIAAFLAVEGNCLGELLKRASGRNLSSRYHEVELDLPSWVPDFRRVAPPLSLYPGRRQICLTKGLPNAPKVLKQTGSLVICGHRLLDLNVQSPTSHYVNDGKIEIFFEKPFKGNTDHVFFIRTSKCSARECSASPEHSNVVSLHLRETAVDHCYTLIGQCTVRISSYSSDITQHITLSFPGESLANDVFPLEREEFKALWTVYQFLTEHPDRGKDEWVEPLPQDWKMQQSIYEDYQRLCSTPLRESRDLVDHPLYQVYKFRRYWEGSDGWQHELLAAKRLAGCVRNYHSFVPSNFSQLLKSWLRCGREAKAAVREFLEALLKDGPEALDEKSDSLRGISFKRINDWKEATIHLMTDLKWAEICPHLRDNPQVYFRPFHYPHGEKTEYPREDGLLIHWHELRSLNYNSAFYIHSLTEATKIFEAMCESLKCENKNLLKFWKRSEFDIEKGLNCLIGDWTELSWSLRFALILGNLTPEEKFDFSSLGDTKLENFKGRKAWRDNKHLRKGEEERIFIV